MRVIFLFALALDSILGYSHVLLMRHCVRSPYPTLRGRGSPGFDEPDNYTAAPFPSASDWNVTETAACTPRGQSLVQVFGSSLKDVLPLPMSLVADNITRNIDTAHRLASGLGAPPSAVSVSGALFDPVKAKLCADLTPAEYDVAIRSQIQQAANSSSYLHPAWKAMPQTLRQLQALVGDGVAPPIFQIPNDVAADGYLGGGLYVASEALIEKFIMEAGSGLPVAWGKLDGDARSALYQSWLALHVLYARINHAGMPIPTRQGGPVLWNIVEQLQANSSHGGTVVLSGHDTTLDAVAEMLELRWQCGHFAENSTPPMSGLLLETTPDGMLKIAAVCAPFEGDSAGKAVFGKVTSLALGDVTRGIPLKDLEIAARRKVDFKCIA